MSATQPVTLVMYSRMTPCPFVSLAKRVLDQLKVGYREIFTDEDPEAEKRVLAWTGFLSVPTLVVAQPGDVFPIEPPMPIVPGSSPRGIDRNSMITEPNEDQLIAWLVKNGLLTRVTNPGSASA